jgi:AraC-like DNA-binding protein
MCANSLFPFAVEMSVYLRYNKLKDKLAFALSRSDKQCGSLRLVQSEKYLQTIRFSEVTYILWTAMKRLCRAENGNDPKGEYCSLLGGTSMDYKMTVLTQEIVIDRIVSVHYFEYTNNFFFPGEAHDFWEFLYVDKGEITVSAGRDTVPLKQGDIIFHKPMEFHNLRTNGVDAPNLVVISFECLSPAMDYFKNARFCVGNEERDLISKIIIEARHAFSSPLDEPHLLYLEKRSKQTAFGCEQLIKLYLEQLLIQMIRKDERQNYEQKTTTSFQEQSRLDVVNRVILYLEQNLHKNLSLDEICKDLLIGRSRLQKIFREKTGCGVMKYFTRMKIEVAKQMIREGRCNFSEIAERLGYSSVYYFSRSFKRIVDMSPTQYSSSVKARLQSAGTEHEP